MKSEGTLSANGVVLGEELLQRILSRFGETGERGLRVVTDVEFDGATFEGSQVDFRNTLFTGRARFNEARFRGPVSFAGSIFKHSPMFEGARFDHDANFGHRGPLAKYAPGREPVFKAAFERRGQFANATFKGAAVFKDASLFNTSKRARGVASYQSRDASTPVSADASVAVATALASAPRDSASRRPAS
jgi:hypothetical protein